MLRQANEMWKNRYLHTIDRDVLSTYLKTHFLKRHFNFFTAHNGKVTEKKGNVSKKKLLKYEQNVPGVPSLVSRRKMTLKLNYIYMKVL
jgi:hypothetical protein